MRRTWKKKRNKKAISSVVPSVERGHSHSHKRRSHGHGESHALIINLRNSRSFPQLLSKHSLSYFTCLSSSIASRNLSLSLSRSSSSHPLATHQPKPSQSSSRIPIASKNTQFICPPSLASSGALLLGAVLLLNQWKKLDLPFILSACEGPFGVLVTDCSETRPGVWFG